MHLKRLSAALATAVFLANAFNPSAAIAQEDPDNNGRYTIVNGVVSTGPGSPEQHVTVLLDSQIGRTWMITIGPEGIHWVRMQMRLLAKVPDTMILRPGPVTPFAPPK
jgi:hypothetical protein